MTNEPIQCPYCGIARLGNSGRTPLEVELLAFIKQFDDAGACGCNQAGCRFCGTRVILARLSRAEGKEGAECER